MAQDQAKTVQPAIGPPNLKEFEPLIRERSRWSDVSTNMNNPDIIPEQWRTAMLE